MNPAVVAAVPTGVLRGVLAAEIAIVVVGVALFFGHGAWTGPAGRRRAARRTEGRAALRSVLEQAADPGADLTPERDRLAALPRRLQIDVLTEVSPGLAGAQQHRLAALAAELGLLADAEARCRSRRWWRRLQGVRLCTLLGGGRGTVPALLGDRRPEVRAAAARWVVGHHDDTLVDRLLGMLDAGDVATRFAVQDALIRIGRPVTDRLAARLAGGGGPAAATTLEVAVALPAPALLPAALALTGDGSPRVRALAARLAGAIGGGPAADTLMRLLGDPAPEVRAAAGRALGKAGYWPAAASLAPLLGDRSWDVRRQSAVALRRLGSPGRLFLQRALSDADPFAADAARQLLDLSDSAVRTL